MYKSSVLLVAVRDPGTQAAHISRKQKLLVGPSSRFVCAEEHIMITVGGKGIR